MSEETRISNPIAGSVEATTFLPAEAWPFPGGPTNGDFDWCDPTPQEYVEPAGLDRAEPADTGRKFDSGKVRWSLFPSKTLVEIAKVLEVGAEKYSVDNWKKVPDRRKRYYDALMRHVEAWWGGEAKDPETGIHHLAHAGCNVLFLLWMDLTGDRGE